MRPTLARLLALLLVGLRAAPAEAAGTMAAAPYKDADAPAFNLVVLPLPLVAMALGATYTNFRLGPTRHEARILGGYFWARNFYYDPLGAAPRALDTPDGQWVPANTWQLRGAWGWRATPWATIFLDGMAIAGGPAATGGYDDALTGGLSASGGPILQLSSLDAIGWPTRGGLLRLGYARGHHWGPTAFGFDRSSIDGMWFVPVGARGTVALRAVAQVAGPPLAGVDKLHAGGGNIRRGFQWNRFTGDRLAAGTLEYRHVVEPDLLARLAAMGVPGVASVPVRLAVASATYVDAGRAWEGRAGLGVPFPQDVRIGGGAGLLGIVDGVVAGRVELNVSAEGIFPVASGGASF